MKRARFAILPLLILGSMAVATSACAANSVRDVFKIQKGCYPVSYDAEKDQIGTVCRGQKNWMPEGAQYFNVLSDQDGYMNKLGYGRNLARDLDEGIGPQTWFEWYFSTLDQKGIPRPK